jgi:hypothetical protein
MLLEPTIDKPHELRLANMADAWQQQQREAKVGPLSSMNASRSWSTPNTKHATIDG